MKKLGIKPVRFPGKTDCHPRKKMKNWWDVECKTKNGKAKERRRVLRELVVDAA